MITATRITITGSSDARSLTQTLGLEKSQWPDIRLGLGRLKPEPGPAVGLGTESCRIISARDDHEAAARWGRAQDVKFCSHCPRRAGPLAAWSRD
jgi:hypothetical protein